MISKTFNFTGNICYNSVNKKPKNVQVDSELWRVDSPCFFGKLYIVRNDIYGYSKTVGTENLQYIRGVVMCNHLMKAPGIAFYKLPTDSRDDIEMYIIPELSGDRFNYWTKRGIFSWFDPQGRVKIGIKEMPHNVDSLMADINRVSFEAKKASRINQRIMSQIESLEYRFREAVRIQKDSMQ